jgi:hypothetical protein
VQLYRLLRTRSAGRQYIRKCAELLPQKRGQSLIVVTDGFDRIQLRDLKEEAEALDEEGKLEKALERLVHCQCNGVYMR